MKTRPAGVSTGRRQPRHAFASNENLERPLQALLGTCFCSLSGQHGAPGGVPSNGLLLHNTFALVHALVAGSEMHHGCGSDHAIFSRNALANGSWLQGSMIDETVGCHYLFISSLRLSLYLNCILE